MQGKVLERKENFYGFFLCVTLLTGGQTMHECALNVEGIICDLASTLF